MIGLLFHVQALLIARYLRGDLDGYPGCLSGNRERYEMLVLVSYDVATKDPGGSRRLNRVAKACLDYGQRVQYSVFECIVDPAHWVVLKQRLIDEIDPEKDSLRFYYLGSNWRFLYLARRIAWHIAKENLSRSLVLRQLRAECEHVFFCQCLARRHSDDNSHNFAETLIRQPDCRCILYVRICVKKILDLYGKNVLAASDDNIFFSINDKEKIVLILPDNVARIKPPIP